MKNYNLIWLFYTDIFVLSRPTCYISPQELKEYIQFFILLTKHHDFFILQFNMRPSVSFSAQTKTFLFFFWFWKVCNWQISPWANHHCQSGLVEQADSQTKWKPGTWILHFTFRPIWYLSSWWRSHPPASSRSAAEACTPTKPPPPRHTVRPIKIKAPYRRNVMSIPFPNMHWEQREQSIFLIEASSW